MSDGPQKVPTPRQSGKTNFTTIARKPYRYGVVEMGSYHDVKVFEKFLKRSCARKARNVSPATGKGFTFSKKKASKWPKYRKDLSDSKYSDGRKDEPEWWYLSGHYAHYGDGQYYAEKDAYGFFNEPYFDAHRKYIEKKKDFPGKITGAIFMTTSVLDSVGVKIEEQVRSNPLFDRTVVKECKGMFLIGCNTLTSPDARYQFRDFYPNALFFGYFFAKAPGSKGPQARHIKSIFASIGKSRPSLFENPSGYFAKHGGEEKALRAIVSKLSRKTRKRTIGVHYKKSIYIPEYYWKGKSWFHSDGLEKFLRRSDGRLKSGEKLILCPVPGKKNPFKYAGGTSYVVGSSSREARVADNFKFSEFARLSGFTRISTYLIMVLQGVRNRVKASVKLVGVSSDGKTVEFKTKFPGEDVKQAVAQRSTNYSVEMKELGPDHYSLKEK